MSLSGRVRKAFDKKIIQASFTGHLTGLPQDILSLFKPGPPLPYIFLMKKEEKLYDLGIASYTEKFEKSLIVNDPPPYCRRFINKEYQYQVRLKETLLEIKRLKTDKRLEYHKKICADQIASFDPMFDPNVEGDPFKTLFVARLSYRVTERELWKNFEEFGAISRTRIVSDKLKGKQRGYAFVEFVRAEDMKLAYKLAMNRNIGGRRIIVDVERGRTVAGWKPRRLGGGLGGESRSARCKLASYDASVQSKNTSNMKNIVNSSDKIRSSLIASEKSSFYHKNNRTQKSHNSCHNLGNRRRADQRTYTQGKTY